MLSALFYCIFALEMIKGHPPTPSQRGRGVESQKSKVESKISNIKYQMSNNQSYIQLFTAALLSIGGLTMLFCGVFIEPHGQIHESLLIGFGEVATFAGALFGIDYVYRERQK